MFALLAAHGLAALLLALPFGRGRRAVAIAAVPPAAALVWLAARAGGVLDGRAVEERLSWVPGLDLGLDLRLDGAALLLALLVAGIGLGIVLYAGGYFGGKPGTGRFLAALVGFGGSMLGLAVSDHLIALYLFWEATTVTSYLLIGHDDRSPDARAAAQQAALVTVLGGLAMLGGIVLLGLDAGTMSISELAAAPPQGGTAAAAMGLILLGALTKSAQFPFHDWLPGAMAAPTPASAYLHSATMVKAGVFLIVRLAPVAAGVGFWTPLVAGIGLTTMFLGGWRALREYDLKLILAYGTVAQLGLLTATAAVAEPAAITAVLGMLAAHALFKAALFMVAGAVDKAAGTRDVRRLGGLGARLPWLFAAALAAGASMAGIPPLLGFVTKEAVLDALVADAPAMAVLVAAGSALTVAYTARVLSVFTGPASPSTVRRPGAWLVGPPLALAVLGLVAGAAPSLVAPVFDAAGASVTGVAGAAKFVLWPGITPALGLSAASLAAGLGLVAARRPFERLQERLPRLPDARAAYRSTVTGLLRLADLSTGLFQSGSLPVYLGVVLVSVLAVPGPALVGAFDLPDGLAIGEGWVQVVVAGLMALSAAALAAVRRRLAALLLLGAVGYGMAALFAVQGAPDLALTQLLIETVSLVVLALVLYRMPVRFRRSGSRGRAWLRLALSAAVGVFVTAAVLTAGADPAERSVSDYYAERSLPDGGGRNIVNVILTDFRALDTFGEITVLTTAALGVGGLLAGLTAARREES